MKDRFLAALFAILYFPSFVGAQECADYFNDEWGVSLNMSDAEHGVLTDIPSAQTKFVSSYSYSAGSLNFTTTGTVPTLTLLQYTTPGSIPVGSRYGEIHPINSSFYRIFRVRMTASESTVASIFWFHDANRYAIGSFSVSQGTNEYAIDLGTLNPGTTNGSNPQWLGGNPQGLIFIPSNESSVVIQVDQIYLTTLGCTSGTVSDLLLNIKRPDKKGGVDFAQTELGNSWNMNSSADLFAVGNVATALLYPFNTLTDPEGTSHIGDFVYTENQNGNGDPGLVVVNRNGQIDSSRFVNFCYRGYNRDDTAFNSVARIFWADPRDGNGVSSYRLGDDIVMARGMREYCVDMRDEIELEPALPAGSPNPWTSIADAGYLIQYLRLDMNEVSDGGSSPYHSVVDQISLRADHESNTRYAVVVDADLSQEVNLYVNSAEQGSGGTFVGTLAAGRNTNVFPLDTTNYANGTYYIYATAARNGHTVTRLADGRLVVNHSRAQDTAVPVLECERPSDGYTFDTQLEAAGYALDESRLAALEVFVDDVYLDSIDPSNFHQTARDTYAQYSESNLPGFQELFTAGAISYGAHTVKLTATDTAGNQTTCSRSVTRTPGGDTAPLTYPSPSGSAVSLPIGNGGFPASQRPRLRISVKRKKNVKFAFSRINNCASMIVYASTNTNMTDPITIFSGAVSGSFSRSFNRFPGASSSSRGRRRKPGTSSTSDGKIFFQAQCNNGAFNSPVAFDVKKKIKSGRKLSEAALISYINDGI